MTGRTRAIGFLLVVVTCLAVAAVYVLRALRPGGPTAIEQSIVDDPAQLDAALREPHVLFRNTALGDHYGRVSLARLNDLGGSRFAAPLRCDRVDMAGGTGVCLTADRGVLTTYRAQIFDARFAPGPLVPLAGIPSRVRVSPDGARAGITVFITGHSYANMGFSTQTTIIDTRQGTTLMDLEQLPVTRDGKPFKEVDFNFWGVTFLPDSNAFYATLASGGVFYLVRGDVAARTLAVAGEGVECPALSPDHTRLGYKKRVVEGGRLIWHLAVRDLATNREQVLDQETRSIDDQVEWLDDDRLLYGTSDDQLGTGRTSIWMLGVHGGAPVKWLADAFSPSIP